MSTTTITKKHVQDAARIGAVNPDPAAWPLLIGLEHLVVLGLAPTIDAARMAVKDVEKWPGIRAENVGRKCLFRRDAVLRRLGL
jgi:hypothetical protein